MREPARLDFANVADTHLREQLRKVDVTLRELGASVKRLDAGTPARANATTRTSVAAGSDNTPVRSGFGAVGSTGNIATTNLVDHADYGLYRVDVYIAATVGGIITVTLGWNDGNATQSGTPILAAVVGANSFAQGSAVLYQAAVGAAITYSTTTTGSPTYTIYINLTKL